PDRGGAALPAAGAQGRPRRGPARLAARRRGDLGRRHSADDDVAQALVAGDDLAGLGGRDEHEPARDERNLLVADSEAARAREGDVELLLAGLALVVGEALLAGLRVEAVQLHRPGADRPRDRLAPPLERRHVEHREHHASCEMETDATGNGAADAVRAHSAPPEGSRPKDTGGTTPATIPVSPLSGQMAIFGREFFVGNRPAPRPPRDTDRSG